ncbi:phosphotransferase [Aquiflexum sp. LQ15W]|uniref:phosphotransferase n=1 Tax=Cognataquiflexum nitidum TaxID=2922272 RepID=UPI001F12DF56|nr:phosphotransferase [Cognataquiflexum nitidum]MCH6200443.1 phosphotransferase [Cognataquiflexum nitidum]
MILQIPLNPLQEKYLRKSGLLFPDEQILEYSKAGEGNMNVVVRLKTETRSLILKQSRPFVVKYPTIPAPLGRIFIEDDYYRIINSHEFLSGFSPKIILRDSKNHLVAMDDLGIGADFMGIYSKKINLSEDEIATLPEYLLSLHKLEIRNFSDNMDMKKLNHEHIFFYPFMEFNGFDLDSIQPGLQAMSMKFKTDLKLKNAVKTLGKRYLEKGKHLLHGDFYPGSWIRVDSGLKVIDPEFAFMGDAEFDLGVLIAHLKMAKANPETIQNIVSHYTSKSLIDEKLLHQYTGTEILRRLIGLAQLPLALTLEEKSALADEAATLILKP